VRVRFPISDLENERGQLIESVRKLQAHENQGYDHQIRTKIHSGLKPKSLLELAGIAKIRTRLSAPDCLANFFGISKKKLPPPRK
jgi:hypothetical protein